MVAGDGVVASPTAGHRRVADQPRPTEPRTTHHTTTAASPRSGTDRDHLDRPEPQRTIRRTRNRADAPDHTQRPSRPGDGQRLPLARPRRPEPASLRTLRRRQRPGTPRGPRQRSPRRRPHDLRQKRPERDRPRPTRPPAATPTTQGP